MNEKGGKNGWLVSFERRLTAIQYKVILNDHLHHMMKHFFPVGSDLFRDVLNGLMSLKKGVNHMVCPSQSTDIERERGDTARKKHREEPLCSHNCYIFYILLSSQFSYSPW